MSSRRADINDELVSLSPNQRPPASQENREYHYRTYEAQETIGQYRALLLRAEGREGLTREVFSRQMQETIGRYQRQIQERDRRDLLQRLLREYQLPDLTVSLQQEESHVPLSADGSRLSVDPPAALNDVKKIIKIPDECHLRSDSELEDGVTTGSCVICLHNKAICVALPCGHLSYCVECSRRMCTDLQGPKRSGKLYVLIVVKKSAN